MYHNLECIMTNLLIALSNIIKNPVTNLFSYSAWSNRANNMGDALEEYIKDIFCNVVHEENIETRKKSYSENFSYLWNKNNPPDIIIKNGDAIEVKKIQNCTSALALNSSYPKNKLYRDDTRITSACRNCEMENWDQKDIIYAIGVSWGWTHKIQSLCFVYGECYAAEREIYTRIAEKISEGITSIHGVEFIATNELAKVKKVDPLWITDLRVRGMWHIENPMRVFRNFILIEKKHGLTVTAIMLEEKYVSFPEQDRKNIEWLQNACFTISNIEIKSPNNPARLLKAKLIHYAK